MNAFKPTRQQVRDVQWFARLCETHARDAARCQAAGKPGAYLAHDGLARGYARQAFALSTRVVAGARP